MTKRQGMSESLYDEIMEMITTPGFQYLMIEFPYGCLEIRERTLRGRARLEYNAGEYGPSSPFMTLNDERIRRVLLPLADYDGPYCTEGRYDNDTYDAYMDAYMDAHERQTA